MGADEEPDGRVRLGMHLACDRWRCRAAVAVLIAPVFIGMAAAPAEGVPQDGVEVALASSDPEEVRSVLHALSNVEGGGADAASLAIVRRLREGLPQSLTIPALDALGALGRPNSVGLLLTFLRHRRPEVRARAAVALAPFRGAPISQALSMALGDRDALVRDAAARALATAGEPDALPRLIRLCERGSEAPIPALVRLTSGVTMPLVLERLEHLPVAARHLVGRLLIARPDLGERPKMRLLRRMADLEPGDLAPFVEAALSAVPPAQARVRAQLRTLLGQGR